MYSKYSFERVSEVFGMHLVHFWELFNPPTKSFQTILLNKCVRNYSSKTFWNRFLNYLLEKYTEFLQKCVWNPSRRDLEDFTCHSVPNNSARFEQESAILPKSFEMFQIHFRRIRRPCSAHFALNVQNFPVKREKSTLVRAICLFVCLF